jgi:hypothetical protein
MALDVGTVTSHAYDSTYPCSYITFQVTGIDYTNASKISVFVVYQDSFYGEYVIQGYDFIDVTSATLNVTDHEISPGLNFQIRVESYDIVDGSANATWLDPSVWQLPRVAIHTGGYYYGAYLRCPSDPTKSQKLLVGSFNETQRENKQLASIDIIGTSAPVVITDAGGMGGRSGTLTTYGRSTLETDETYAPTWQQIEELLTPGVPLLFQPYYPQQTGEAPLYMSVKSFSKKRVTLVVPDSADEQLFVQYDINFTECDRASANGVSPTIRTWADVAAEAATYTTVGLIHPNYLHVLRGF